MRLLTVRGAARLGVIAVLDFDEELGDVSVVKRHGGGQHHVENDPQTPDVALWALVRLALDDFRRRIERAPHTASGQRSRWNKL